MRELRGAWAGLWLLAACSEGVAAPSPAAAPAPVVARDASVQASAHAPVARVAPPKPVRRISIKEVTDAGDDVQAGARLPLPRGFVLPEKGRLTLDFEHGARVRLSGPARALADVSDQDLFLCGAGSVSVDLAPSAPTPSSGFALLTPAGMLTLVRGGRYALRVAPDGSTQGFVVSGGVTLRAAAAAPADQEGWLLGPGESFTLSPAGGLKRGKHALATLAEAEAAALALKPRKGGRADGGPPVEVLDAAIADTQRLKAQQDAMLSEHRALARARDGGAERLAELQRDLAEEAERLARARARLRLALGQRAAAAQTPALGGEDAPSELARQLLSP